MAARQRLARNMRTWSGKEHVYGHEKKSTWGLWVVDALSDGVETGAVDIKSSHTLTDVRLYTPQRSKKKKAFGKERVKLWLNCRLLQESRIKTSRGLVSSQRRLCSCAKQCVEYSCVLREEFSCLLIYVFINDLIKVIYFS